MFRVQEVAQVQESYGIYDCIYSSITYTITPHSLFIIYSFVPYGCLINVGQNLSCYFSGLIYSLCSKIKAAMHVSIECYIIKEYDTATTNLIMTNPTCSSHS